MRELLAGAILVLLATTVLGAESVFDSPIQIARDHHPKMRLALYDLYQSQQAGEQLENNLPEGMNLQNANVHVIILLTDKESGLPWQWAATETARYNEKIEAWVPVENLVRIADDPLVQFVDTADVPLQNARAPSRNPETVPTAGAPPDWFWLLLGFACIVAAAGVFWRHKRKKRKSATKTN